MLCVASHKVLILFFFLFQDEKTLNKLCGEMDKNMEQAQKQRAETMVSASSLPRPCLHWEPVGEEKLPTVLLHGAGVYRLNMTVGSFDCMLVMIDRSCGGKGRSYGRRCSSLRWRLRP